MIKFFAPLQSSGSAQSLELDREGHGRHAGTSDVRGCERLRQHCRSLLLAREGSGLLWRHARQILHARVLMVDHHRVSVGLSGRVEVLWDWLEVEGLHAGPLLQYRHSANRVEKIRAV